MKCCKFVYQGIFLIIWLNWKFIEIRKKEKEKERGWMKNFYFKYPIKMFLYLEMDYISI